jgi:pimeloyl-ACP methyl ester carboxylesterase
MRYLIRPADVAGIVLVDPLGWMRDLTAAFNDMGLGESGYDRVEQTFQWMADQIPLSPGATAEMQVSRQEYQKRTDWDTTTGPAIPSVILLAGTPFNTRGMPGNLISFWRDLGSARQPRRIASFASWVRGSRDGVLILTTRAGHCVHCDDPELVAAAVRRVVASAQSTRELRQ